MLTLKSFILATNSVQFPEPTNLRAYMVPFFQTVGLPLHLAHYQATVDAMLVNIKTDLPIYIMIDEGEVTLGLSQRRRGLHIDGYWNAAGKWDPKPDRWGPVPLSAHGGQQQPSHHHPRPGHAPLVPESHAPQRHSSQASSWETATFEAPEGIILASTMQAARGFVGDYEGPVKDGGDCAHIDVSGMIELPMLANTVYAGNVCCLHESLPVTQDGYRQLVRLNVPGWTP